MLLDGVGAGPLADDLVEGLRQAGRTPLRVRGEQFLRPAGEALRLGP